MLANPVQEPVAAAAVLQKQAEVEQGLPEYLGVDQHQHDQQPAQATVAVEERVDRPNCTWARAARTRTGSVCSPWLLA